MQDRASAAWRPSADASLDFRLAHKLYARTPLQKPPLSGLWQGSANMPWGTKKKKKYTTQTVKGSDLVCRFWCPISTFADVSFVMAFHRENVFSGVGGAGGIWMPYIIQCATEQPIRKVIYFSQRKCCFCNAQVSEWRCPGFVSHCAAAQMSGDDTAMTMYGGGDQTRAV